MMRSMNRSGAAFNLAGYAVALLLVAASTAAGLLVAERWGNAPVVMLFLPPVLAAAIYAGLRPGLMAAVASTLAFNYYFTQPYHTLAITSAADVVTVVTLFMVALVSSHLAASVRRQARLASEHAARNAAIAGFARRLLSMRSDREVAQAGAQQLADLFGCQVTLLDARDPFRPVASAPAAVELNPGDLAAAAFALEAGERSGRGEKRASQADWQFHPVLSGERVLAAIGLARDDGTAPVAPEQALLFESLVDQLALALERARLDDEASAAAALRASDKLRAALLASIGDDVKPRLKAIQAVTRALRRSGNSDRALVAELDGEVAQVDRYIDNLVDLSPGTDGQELVIGEVAIDLHRRLVLRGGTETHLAPKEFAVLAELAKHAGRVLTHAQILRAVWGPAQQDHVDYLRVAIRGLRQKLEHDPARPALIVNEPGVGYRLVLR